VIFLVSDVKTENDTCMYGVCTSFSGVETLKVLLWNELDGMIIEYKQWIVTERATLVTVRQ
jgi:hypothetical protein